MGPWASSLESLRVRGPVYMFHNMALLMVRNYWHLTRPLNWWTTPCWLFMTTNSTFHIWSHLLHPQYASLSWRQGANWTWIYFLPSIQKSVNIIKYRKSTVFCLVTPCKSIRAQRFVVTYRLHSFPHPYASFFDPEDRSDTFLQIIGLFPKCTALQPIVSALRTSNPTL
jgi:hypothetical protein